MKRISLVAIILVIFVLTASAEEWINFNDRGESSPIYDVIHSTDSFVKFEVEIPGMNSRDIDNYNRLYIPEHTKMDSVGFPEVPVVSYLIAIPECDNVNLNITLLDSIEIENINIYPAPQCVEVNNGDIVYMEEQFNINNTFYNTDEYFPGYNGELVEKGAVRSQHCIRIKIYPVQFNPVEQKVIAYSSMNIEMTFENATGSVNEDVGIFNEVCGNAMINYISNGLSASINCGSNRDGSWQWIYEFPGEYIIQDCDYLIVTHQNFHDDPNAKVQIELLAQKRADYNGFDIVIIKMDDIIGQIYSQDPDDHAEKIRNLIKNTYESYNANHTFDNRLGYVLLFGDCYFGASNIICVPSHPMPDPNGNPDPCKGYDVYFSKLTEINGYYDVYPDVLIGRLPADDEDNFSQVENVCQKIIDYEPIDVRLPPQGVYDGWKDRMTFLAGEPFESDMHEGLMIISPIVESYEPDITTTLLHHPADPFDEIYFDHRLEHDLVNGLLFKYAQGNLILTYMGHGNSNDWAWSEFDNYPYWFNFSDDIGDPECEEYDNRLPLIFSMACITGAFHNNNDDCMAEQFLVYNRIRGSIGFIGSSTNTYGSSFSQFAPNLFKAPFQYTLGMCGELLLEAKLNSSLGYINQYNLFGDPALNILLDTDNIYYCDLHCSHQELRVENMNNQTLRINVGVKNLSYVTANNVEVLCELTNNMNYSASLTQTIPIIQGMETIGLDFDFNIADELPAEFNYLVDIDPNFLIDERTDNNNTIESNYIFLREQNGYPVPIYEDHTISGTPLYDDQSIIIGGKKHSSDGSMIWVWEPELETSGSSIPVFNETESCFDYFILNIDRNRIHRINGNNGSTMSYYYSGEHIINSYCLGDLNNDGELELICFLFKIGAMKIMIFDSELNILLEQPVDNIFFDLAVGDGNNDGINELYTLCTFYNNKIISYSFNGQALNIIAEQNLNPGCSKFFLEDFDNNGSLDCAVFARNSVHFFNCPDLTPSMTTVTLNSDYKAVALGDIDNDSVTEIVLFEGDYYVTKIDLGQHTPLFSVDDQYFGESPYYMLLYDIDSDLQMDVIINDNMQTSFFNSNGDYIFTTPLYPEQDGITTNIIIDIDNDNDIELVYGMDIVTNSYANYHDSKLMVVDLMYETSIHGNIYPKMNKYNNNLYSQPISGQLSENTNYYLYGSITLHDEVILPATSSLTIHPSTIIKAKENSKLIVYGDFVVNGTENEPVKFEPIIQGASQDYWQGLEFPEGNGDIELNHVYIQNANLYSEREITINGGSFINTPLLQDRQSVWLTDVNFDNSPITAELYGMIQIEIVSINNCHIYNSLTDAGIEITGYPNIDISYNVIENCDSGLKIWESGSGAINSISNNIIRNNTQNYGISIYHSYIDITDHNRIENNRNGLFISRESNFNLIGSETYPLQIIRDNNEHEVRFTYDSRPGQFYHNKIYDENHEYSYVKCERVPPIEISQINISNNNWGSTFNPETDLSPTELFIYLPIWDPGIPRNPDIGTDEEMYLLAKQQEEAEDYFEAEQTYKQIISIYPASEYAKIAAKELLALKVKYDQDFAGLKLYYETEPNMQYDEEMTRLSEFQINCCDIKLEEFQPAISWFEEIIQNPPSIADSVFAVIDAGYTYLLMENSGRSQYVGKINDLKPESRIEYEEKRDNLMNMLFGDSEPDNEIPSIIKLALFPNYPNPFNPTTIIPFSIPKESKIDITVYNIKGQKVKTITKDVFEKGFHKLIWNGKDSSGKEVGSGIYFYKLKVNGKDKSVRKCLLLK